MSTSSPRQLFVTTALPYANGAFHIGHIMEYIQADIWVRFQRMQGNEVHFVGADDAHGAPIMIAAEPVKNMFLPDRYIKGECPKCGTKDQYGDSCENCSAVYAPTDLKNPYSTLSGATPVMKSSEHFFFKLSDPKCVAFLREWALDNHRLQPEVANKAKEWLDSEGGLGDWDISRDAPYFGIEIPDAPGKYFYVWLDAPIGYLASLKNYFNKSGRDFDAFMADEKTEQYHFIGKDITYFHTLFWPAMLKFAGRKVPNNVFVHGFITVSGEKMSKSRGTGISPLRYLDIGMNLLHCCQTQCQGRRR